jgi:Domain of unknown function (DUF4360)
MSVKLSRGKKQTATALAGISALFLSGPAHAQAAGSSSPHASSPPVQQITVDVLTVNGSGCPSGTADVTANRDNTGFTVKYSSFTARAGGTVQDVDSRKNCQITVLLHIPQGFTFAIADAQYSGTAHLEEGATALQRTNYYLQGSPDNHYADHTFAGPLRSRWATADITPVAALVFAPCGKATVANLDTELRVDEGTAHPDKVSSISMKSTDGDIYTIVHFDWKTC